MRPIQKLEFMAPRLVFRGKGKEGRRGREGKGEERVEEDIGGITVGRGQDWEEGHLTGSVRRRN